MTFYACRIHAHFQNAVNHDITLVFKELADFFKPFLPTQIREEPYKYIHIYLSTTFRKYPEYARGFYIRKRNDGTSKGEAMSPIRGLPTDFQAKEYTVEKLSSGEIVRDDYELNCDAEACYLTVWHARYEDASRWSVYLDVAEPANASCSQFAIFHDDRGAVMGGARRCDDDSFSTPIRLCGATVGGMFMVALISNTLLAMTNAGEGGDEVSGLREYINRLAR